MSLIGDCGRAFRLTVVIVVALCSAVITARVMDRIDRMTVAEMPRR